MSTKGKSIRVIKEGDGIIDIHQEGVVGDRDFEWSFYFDGSQIEFAIEDSEGGEKTVTLTDYETEKVFAQMCRRFAL